jgi:hypothetical protein
LLPLSTERTDLREWIKTMNHRFNHNCLYECCQPIKHATKRHNFPLKMNVFKINLFDFNVPALSNLFSSSSQQVSLFLIFHKFQMIYANFPPFTVSKGNKKYDNICFLSLKWYFFVCVREGGGGPNEKPNLSAPAF